jgi:uncharacterized integral membrane protein
MTKLQILILIMSLIDLTATYFYVGTFHNKFPQLDYKTLEANPILRMAWTKFGLNWGMIIGGIIVFAILFLIIMTAPEKWHMYLAGVFTMMIIYHFLNFAQLAALKPVGAP